MSATQRWRLPLVDFSCQVYFAATTFAPSAQVAIDTFPGFTMSSFAGKVKTNIVCTHCGRRIRWAWVIRYRSYHLTQYVYLCSSCEQVITVAKERVKKRGSPGLSVASILLDAS
jgi:DNA-directed RNA polymerase subunit RPC12/RpoP